MSLLFLLLLLCCLPGGAQVVGLIFCALTAAFILVNGYEWIVKPIRRARVIRRRNRWRRQCGVPKMTEEEINLFWIRRDTSENRRSLLNDYLRFGHEKGFNGSYRPWSYTRFLGKNYELDDDGELI